MGTTELVAAVRFRSVRMSHTHRGNALAVGLLGRSGRGQDAEELRVVHAKDLRIRIRG
jgi:hypothetical protein